MQTAQYPYTILKWNFLHVCHLYCTTTQALMPAQLTDLTATLPTGTAYKFWLGWS